jgi:DNA-binding NarL/FixJ family response regulator
MNAPKPPDPSTPGRIGVLLVEDHPATRDGLRAAIECQPDLVVVGEASTWRDAMQLAKERRTDVLVLDLNLPDGNGWSLVEQLGSQGTLPRTLVLSVCDETIYARRLLNAGARGYLMKDEPLATILDAIREIHAGRLVASRTISSELMHEALRQSAPTTSSAEPACAGSLSDRELQVYGLLARKLSNKEIAACLSLSEKTVHTYKTRLMTKLGVRTTPELEARCQG